ncbi:MAG: EamA family transporter [Candidatus Omnitrophica bacterium]|nr:EamA family transporter [Candidatus Omnitrophota bacterium]
MSWLLLGMVVAVLTSAQDILNKQMIGRTHLLAVTWGWWFFSMPLLYGGLLFSTPSKITSGFWVVLFFSTVLITIGVLCYVKALESDLSISIPMLNFTPLLLLLTSPLITKETPRLMGIVGVMLIVAGAYVMFIRSSHTGLLGPMKALVQSNGPRYMLVVAVVFSISGNLDKIGVMHSSPLLWPVFLNTTLSAVLSVILLFYVPSWKEEIFRHYPKLIIIGTINGAALWVQMVAIQWTQVPYLIAVKRTSVLISALYGFLILKEGGLKERLPGILMMITGVFLIAFT